MAVHVVIDGYNVTRRRPHAGVTDIDAEREVLISQLQAYKKARRVKVTVVFDAPSSPALAERSENHGGVRVVYTGGGTEADELIKRMAKEKRDGLTVVTSDAGVARYCAAVGAVVVGSEEFEGLLEMALYEDMKGVDPEDEDDDDGGRGGGKKGPSRKEPRKERKKRNRMKKL